MLAEIDDEDGEVIELCWLRDIKDHVAIKLCWLRVLQRRWSDREMLAERDPKVL